MPPTMYPARSFSEILKPSKDQRNWNTGNESSQLEMKHPCVWSPCSMLMMRATGPSPPRCSCYSASLKLSFHYTTIIINLAEMQHCPWCKTFVLFCRAVLYHFPNFPMLHFNFPFAKSKTHSVFLPNPKSSISFRPSLLPSRHW